MTTPIPFSLDLWNTGKYTAVYRNGNPARIKFTDGSGGMPIASDDGTGTILHAIDGRTDGIYLDMDEDLFLLPIPEPEVRYVSYGWVNEYPGRKTVYDTKEHADYNALRNRLRCVELFVREEVK